jgi:AraC family transcriptional regulator
MNSMLGIQSVTCPIGELENPQDDHHVLYFHTGRPVQLTCRLDGRELGGGLHSPGNFCVVPAGVPSRWDMEARADSMLLRFSPLLVQETARSLKLKAAQAALEPLLQMRDPHLEYIGWLVKSETEAGFPCGNLFLESAAEAIAARLLRRQNHRTDSPRPYRYSLPKWRLRAVCDYIWANLDQDLSLTALAEIAGFSVSHFKPLFRQAMGMPVHRYVVECRVERARQLLVQGELQMGDIALEAGFAHSSHMVRCLRRVLGIGAAEFARFSRPVSDPSARPLLPASR